MARTYKQTAIDNISQQFAYTNVSSFLEKLGEKLDVAFGTFHDKLFRDVYNLDTCKTTALDNYWGKFLGVSRGLVVNEEDYIMNDSEYRLALKMAAFKLNWDGTNTKLNAFLKDVFKDYGRAFVNDVKGMKCYLVLNFEAGDFILALCKSDIMPRACGVENYTILSEDIDIFGFEGQELQNFDNGVFMY